MPPPNPPAPPPAGPPPPPAGPPADELSEQLKLIQQLTLAMLELTKVQQLSGNVTSSQRDAMSQVGSSFKDLDAALEKARKTGETWRDGIKKQIGEIESFSDATNLAGKALKHLAKENKTLGSALAFGAGAAKGLSATFSFLKAASTGLFGAITSIAGAVLDLGAAILSAPFKMLEGLISMAKEGMGSTELAQAGENVREVFGDLSKNAGKSVMDLGRSLTQGMIGPGLSSIRVFGTLAESIEYANKVASVAPVLFTSMRGEFEKNGKAILAMAKGLGIADEDFAGLLSSAKATGQTIESVEVDIAKYAKGLSAEFGLNSKLMSRDIGRAMKDVKHFANSTVKEIAKATAYAHGLGLELKDITGVLDAFNTFDQASENVSKLSQAFGVNIDAMKLLEAKTPDDALKMLKDSFSSAGKSVENMNRQELQLLASSVGMTEENVRQGLSSKNLGISHNKIATSAQALERQTLSTSGAISSMTEDIVRAVKAGPTVESNTLWGIFFEGFLFGVKRTKEFQNVLNSLRKDINLVKQAGAELGAEFVSSFPGMTEILEGLADVLAPSKIGGLFSSFKNTFTQFFKDLREGTGTVKGLMAALQGNFTDYLTKAGPGGQKLLQGLQDFWAAAKAIIVSGLDYLGDMMKDAFEGLADMMAGDDKGMGKVLSSIQKEASPIISAFKGLFKKIKGPLVEILKQIFAFIGDQVGAFFDEHFYTILAFTIGPSIVTGISSLILKSIGNKILSAAIGKAVTAGITQAAAGAAAGAAGAGAAGAGAAGAGAAGAGAAGTGLATAAGFLATGPGAVAVAAVGIAAWSVNAVMDINNLKGDLEKVAVEFDAAASDIDASVKRGTQSDMSDALNKSKEYTSSLQKKIAAIKADESWYEFGQVTDAKVMDLEARAESGMALRVDIIKNLAETNSMSGNLQEILRKQKNDLLDQQTSLAESLRKDNKDLSEEEFDTFLANNSSYQVVTAAVAKAKADLLKTDKNTISPAFLANKAKKGEEERKKLIAEGDAANKRTIAALGETTVDNVEARIQQILAVGKKVSGSKVEFNKNMDAIRDDLATMNFSLFKSPADADKFNESVGRMQQVITFVNTIKGAITSLSDISKAVENFGTIKAGGSVVGKFHTSMGTLIQGWDDVKAILFGGTTTGGQVIRSSFANIDVSVENQATLTEKNVAFKAFSTSMGEIATSMTAVNTSLGDVIRTSGSIKANTATLTSTLAAKNTKMPSFSDITKLIDGFDTDLASTQIPANLARPAEFDANATAAFDKKRENLEAAATAASKYYETHNREAGADAARISTQSELNLHLATRSQGPLAALSPAMADTKETETALGKLKKKAELFTSFAKEAETISGSVVNINKALSDLASDYKKIQGQTAAIKVLVGPAAKSVFPSGSELTTLVDQLKIEEKDVNPLEKKGYYLKTVRRALRSAAKSANVINTAITDLLKEYGSIEAQSSKIKEKAGNKNPLVSLGDVSRLLEGITGSPEKANANASAAAAAPLSTGFSATTIQLEKDLAAAKERKAKNNPAEVDYTAKAVAAAQTALDSHLAPSAAPTGPSMPSNDFSTLFSEKVKGITAKLNVVSTNTDMTVFFKATEDVNKILNKPNMDKLTSASTTVTSFFTEAKKLESALAERPADYAAPIAASFIANRVKSLTKSAEQAMLDFNATLNGLKGIDTGNTLKVVMGPMLNALGVKDATYNIVKGGVTMAVKIDISMDGKMLEKTMTGNMDSVIVKAFAGAVGADRVSATTTSGVGVTAAPPPAAGTTPLAPK